VTTAEAAPSAAGGNKLAAWVVALGVTGATTSGVYYAFHPSNAGSGRLLLVLGVIYAVLVGGTVLWTWRRGELREQFAPSGGDISIGALLALLLYVAATLTHKGLTAQGSPREPWMMRLYLHIGDPNITAAFAVGVSVLAIGAAEEVAWRGWVMRALVSAYGDRFGWLASSALYTLAHLPTVWLLSDPTAGPNPLVVLGAAGCGLVWGYLALRIGRLGPSLFSHALFSWAVVEFPLWRM
jgi:membrane protease YdiL (CAAX protease family)